MKANGVVDERIGIQQRGLRRRARKPLSQKKRDGSLKKKQAKTGAKSRGLLEKRACAQQK